MTRRRISLALLTVVIVWALTGAFMTYSAYRDASAGRKALNDLRLTASSATDRQSLTSDLGRASERFGHAHQRLASPFVSPWRALPVVGRQITSARDLTQSGATVTAVARDSLEQVDQLTSQQGNNRAGALAQLTGVAANASARLANIDFGPRDGLIRPLATTRNKMISDVDRMQRSLERATAATAAVGSLFDTKGSYLVLAANNSEMRSGSGMLLSAGTLTTGGGNISLSPMRSVSNYESPVDVNLPPEYQHLWGFMKNRRIFQNLMLSPRFDQNAPLAVQMWANATGKKVDGVLVIDPQFLGAVLQATGNPVEVNGQPISADAITQYLQVDQYKAFDADNFGRRDALSDIATQAFTVLDRGDWSPLPMARALADVSDGRHVLAYSVDAAINGHWQAAGVGGTLDDRSLMLDLVNVGGNKLDPYVKVDTTIETTTNGDVRNVSLRTVLTSTAPTSGPQYAIGPYDGSDLSPGEYSGVFGFSLPGAATDIAHEGNYQTQLGGRDGPTQATGVYVNLAPGETKTVVVRFRLPTSMSFVRVEPSARVPAVGWSYSNEKWSDSSSHFVIFDRR